MKLSSKLLLFLSVIINWLSPQVFLIGFITKDIFPMMFGIACFILSDFLYMNVNKKIRKKEEAFG